MPRAPVRRQSRTQHKCTAWRLQTQDLRGGLAFVTYRPAQPRDDPDAEVEDWPCMFFCPPHFTPEPVDNVALALAASRRAFDEGLFIDDNEVGFADLDDVGEFLRRAYVGSSGGDGNDAPDGGYTPLPPVDDGPRLPFLDEESDSDERALALHMAFDAFREKASRSSSNPLPERGANKSFAFDWSPVAAGDATGSLRRGARHILFELMARCPASASSDRRLRWEEDLRVLGGFSARCGALGGPYMGNSALQHEHMKALVHRLGSTNSDAGEMLLRAWDNGAPWLLLKAPELLRGGRDVIHFWREWEYMMARFGPWHRSERFWPAASDAVDVDPIDALSRWPAPTEIRTLGAASHEGTTSVRSVLSALTATPTALTALDLTATKIALDVLAFAAACVTSGHSQGPTHWWSWAKPKDDVLAGHARHCAMQAMRWLVLQLPRRGFEKTLEAQLLACRNLEYGKRPA